jgi:ABC-type multidrug transport system fused ATPase/permease subunit
MDIIKELFRNNYKYLILVYSLFVIESVLFLIYPLVLGDTIDKIINKEYYYVIYLIIVLCTLILIAYLRRITDTKVFTTLYRKVVLEYINKELDNNKDTSTINARSSMLRSIVDFLEIDFPYIFHSIFSIVGSVVIISVNYNLYVGLFVGFFIVPILLSSRYFSKKLSVKYSESNDLQEKDVNILNTRNITNIKHHYINKNLLKIRISNIDAKYNSTNEFINYSLIILSLVMFTVFESVTVGTIMALYQYIIKFTQGAFTVPALTIRYLYLKDVIGRISEK